MHLLHSTSDGIHDPADRVVDGDGNGEINVADLTPLGAGLLRRVDAYRLESSTNGGADWAVVTDVPFATSVLPGDGGFRQFAIDLSNPVDGAWYRVVAVGGGEDGGASNVVTYGAGLQPITGLTATQGTVDGAVELNWNANPDATQGYNIWRSDSAVGPYTQIGTAAVNTYSDTSVLPSVHWYYKVEGVGDDGPFGMSSAVQGWAMDTLSPPAPENLAASDGSATDEITLSWDAVGVAVEYHVWRSATAGSGHVEIGATADTTYSDPVSPGDEFYYYVTSEDAGGLISAPSNEDHGFAADPVGNLTLTLVSPPAVGSGTAIDPYLVPASTSWQFTLVDSIDGDVTLLASYTVSDIVALSVSGDDFMIGSNPALNFHFYGTHNGQDSNTVYFQLQSVGGPPVLSLNDPPPLGSGTFGDPYRVPPDSDFMFTLIDPPANDVTNDPGSVYWVSDPNVQISGSTLLVGPTPPPSFHFYGSYNSQQSNFIYFEVQSGPPGLVIYPASIDPNWFMVEGSGSQADPFQMHNAGFNPDNDFDGICDLQFWLWAEDANGDPLDNELLEWYYVPFPTADMVIDINDVGSKGKFHVRMPLDPIENGYLYASDGVNESNKLYLETWQ